MKTKNNGHLVGFGDITDFEESPTAPVADQFDSKQEFEDYFFDKTYTEIVRRENEERQKKEDRERKVARKKPTKTIKTHWRTR